MAFINRFIRVPVQVYYQTEAEITGNRVYEDSYAYILPTEIDEMFPSERAEGEMENGTPNTQCYMKSGRGFLVELPIDEFIKRLNEYFA